MNTEGFKRTLSAILSADLVGHILFMRDDQEATGLTLKWLNFGKKGNEIRNLKSMGLIWGIFTGLPLNISTSDRM